LTDEKNKPNDDHPVSAEPSTAAAGSSNPTPFERKEHVTAFTIVTDSLSGQWDFGEDVARIVEHRDFPTHIPFHVRMI
jgi:hypothetical protein